MSLFLIYFEVGKPIKPSLLLSPIHHFPVSLTFKGRSGAPRQALALTDGGSSAAFLAFGNKVLAREGEVLRQSLLAFLRERLTLGAHPHLVFLWFDGLVESASIDIESKTEINIEKFNQTLKKPLEPEELIEIVRE